MSLPDRWVEISFVKDTTDSSYLWRDVSADVEWDKGVSISRRRSNEVDEVQPGKLSLSLLNTDGRYTAGNTAGIHYPNVKINRPIRVRARWPVSVNLLYPGQAAGSDASLWSVSQGSKAVDTGVFPGGQTSSIRWDTGTLSGTGQALRIGTSVVTTATDQAIPVSASTAYAFSAQARRDASAALSVSARIRWYDSAGAFISESTGSTLALSTSFQSLTATGTSPASAVWARIQIANTTTTAGSIAVYVSACQFEQAASPTTWVAAGTEYMRYVGFVDRWPHAWYNGVLGYVRLTATDAMKLLARQLLRSIATIADNQLSGARALGLLSPAGYTSLTADVDTGVSYVGLTGNEATTSILANLRLTAKTEAGLFFIARTGRPAYHDRLRRQAPSSTIITLTADQCGPDLNFVIGDELLLNDVTVTTDAGVDATAQVDSASVTAYGTYSTRLQTLLQTTGEGVSRAQALLAQYAEPRPWAGQITIEANPLPALWPSLLASDIGQRVQVTSLPSNAPTATLDLWVEGVQETITDQSWTFQLDPSPAAATASLVLDDSTYGLLDSGNAYGW